MMKKTKPYKSRVCEVADKYKFGYQRVYNWTIRGIPYRIQVEYPEIKRMLGKELTENGERR